MGNFSRNPELRLADAESKHYIGHRVQQGVPLLDADLHLMDGLYRGELESVGRWMLGSGVPVGSDAFRVSAPAGGGVNTIVLVANTAATGPSSIAVDLVGSTAAAALGFDATNATAVRVGDSPAQVTSRNAEPFVLQAGDTLVVTADGGAAETVTFLAADFTNIAAATAAEVVAKIAASAAAFTPSAGVGADFLIAGGDGTTAGAGRILVDGRMVLIERGLRYTEQPLYQNAALAAAWGVTPVPALPTPAVNESQTVYVDVWHREVGRGEDPAIVDSRIGIETAVSLRREWAVRVTPTAQFAAALAARPPGHAYYPVAELKRSGSDPKVTAAMVVDLRDTDASLRTEIAYRNAAGVVLVNSDRFRVMLAVTRDGARDLVTYLTTKFVLPSATYTAAEIAGVEALSAIASAADHATGALNARTLSTQGALGVMRQLYDAERRFVTTWQAVLLPLVKGGTTPYAAAFTSSVALIKAYLDGPAPGGNVAINAALTTADLGGAVASQERIAAELAAQSGRPLGTVALKYLGSAAPLVQRNVPIDLRYEVSGTITPDDDLDAQVFIDPQWSFGFKNGDGSTPFALHAGPGVFTRQFFVTVTPPDVPAAQSLYSVEIHARRNPAGVAFLTTQKTLQIGAAPPPSEDQFAITVQTASVPAAAGVFQVVRGTMADVTFRVKNNTGTAVAIDLAPSTSAVWTITKGPFALTNQPVPALGTADFLWHFTAPGTVGTPLSFTLAAKDNANPATVLAEVTVSFVTT